METSLNFDVSTNVDEIVKNLVVPIVNKKSIDPDKTMEDVSFSKLVSDVKVSDLMIDMSYQRKPNALKVNKIAKDFNPDAFGVLICSMRNDGVIAVIDGGHRLAALHLLNMKDSFVRCLVFFDLTIDQEASIFSKINNNRTKPKTSDIFKSNVVAGDKDSIAIQSILDANGLKVHHAAGFNSIRAIGTITRIYNNYGYKVLANTVKCLRLAYGNHSTSFANNAILTLGKFFSVYGDEINETRLVDILKSYGNCNLWVNKGLSISSLTSNKEGVYGMGTLLINDYNKRLTKNKIDPSKFTA